MQRGLHKQDDLEDLTGAMADYEQSLSMNSLAAGTCQIVTSATLVNGALPATLNPAPCMFTLRLRMAYLLRSTNPARSISLYNEVLQIDPLRLGVNQMIGETYVEEAKSAKSQSDATVAYQNAISAFRAEIALSPVDAQYTALTGDTANNAHVHWALAEVYDALGQHGNEIGELQLYLQASQWHSDVYPWRIPLAQKKIQELQKPSVVRPNRRPEAKQ
jgi:tetratricopeptide (TPR) repeat protein